MPYWQGADHAADDSVANVAKDVKGCFRLSEIGLRLTPIAEGPTLGAAYGLSKGGAAVPRQLIVVR